MNPLDGMLFGLSVATQPINLLAGMVEKFKRRYGTGKKTEAAASA